MAKRRVIVQITADDLRLLALGEVGEPIPEDARMRVYADGGLVDIGPQADNNVIVELEW